VLLDSPIFAGWRAWLFAAAKRLGVDAGFSPAASTLRRRVQFDSFHHAKSYLQKRSVFARLDEDVLRDYLGDPLDQDAHLRLRFDAAIEAHIYRTIPHRLSRLARRPCPVPIGFLAGTRSHELRMLGLDPVYRFVGQNIAWIDGSHLFPLERPHASAAAIKTMFARLAARAN
jgi:hypothetical protein